MSAVAADTTDALLAEYAALKDEQRDRIVARDNLTYVTLAALAAAVAGVLQVGRPVLLLAVPPVCAVLGWTRLTNDAKVTAIGRYIRAHLGRRLSPERPVFTWETHHHRGVGRRLRKVLQLAADLLTFCGPGVAALVAVLASRHPGAPGGLLAPVAVADIGVVAVLAWQIVTHADLASDDDAAGR